MILVGLTAHGYGHLGQTAPILNALRDVELVVATTLPPAVLARQLTVPFTRVERVLDVGVRNLDALTVDSPATAAAYRAFHREYDLDGEIAWLRALQPSAILANVPYRLAEAARELGIPCFGMCSLRWADIVDVPELPWIRRAYACMTEFWQPTPSMPMADQPRRRALGLVSRRGRRVSLGKGKFVLVSLGGLPFPPPVAWPRVPGVTWLVPEGWDLPDSVEVDRLGIPFIDVVASVDALITKPGYGTFAEAACHGLPVMSLRRPDWPEEPYLWEYLRARGGLLELTRSDFLSGRIPVEELLALPRPEPIDPSGVGEAVERLTVSVSGRC